MKTYKALLIDWDNTIGDFAQSELRSLREIYDEFHLSEFYPKWEELFAVYHPYNQHLWELYGRGEIDKDALNMERFSYPLRHALELEHAPKAVEDLAGRLAERFMYLTTQYFSPMPHACEVVPELAKKYRLIILSNGFGEVQYEKIDRSGLRSYFEDIVLSEEVGAKKPSEEIYRIALERNGLTVSDCLMVGDSYFSDISGAKAIGMDQVWVHLPGIAKNEGEEATYEVDNLMELKELVLGF